MGGLGIGIPWSPFKHVICVILVVASDASWVGGLDLIKGGPTVVKNGGQIEYCCWFQKGETHGEHKMWKNNL